MGIKLKGNHERNAMNYGLGEISRKLSAFMGSVFIAAIAILYFIICKYS